MSNNIVSALSTFGPLIGDTISDYALITQGARSIGDLYPHVVVEETHNDELTITRHPVEFGSPPTDHAFMQPYSVEIRCGWSNSTAQTSGYVQAVYQAFLALQASRVPFSIQTGKRTYASMLLRTLMAKTDPDSEFTLMCVATAEQFIVTNTQMVAGGTAAMSNGSTLPPSSAASQGVTSLGGNVNPGATALPSWSNDVSGTGTQVLVPVPNAIPLFPGQP